MAGGSLHVFRAHAVRGFTIIPSWIPGQILLDITVMLVIIDCLCIGWYYTIHFWDFLVDFQLAMIQKRFPVRAAKVYKEVGGYSFQTSLFDVPLMAFFRAAVIIGVWVKSPEVSFPILSVLGLVFLAVKSHYYQYTIVVEGFDFFQGDAVALLTLALCFCCAELVFISLGNYKTRKDKLEREKFRVRDGRCPVCTLPVAHCKHVVYRDSLKVHNQWDRDILDFSQESCENGTRMVLCCSCPCAESDVAVGVGNPFCCLTCCGYSLLALFGVSFGAHALIGAFHRWRLRRQGDIEGTPFRDWVEHWCCPVCALTQEKWQLEVLKNKNGTSMYRDQPETKVPGAPPTTEEMLREDIEGIENIAGNLSAGIAVAAQATIVDASEKHGVGSKVRALRDKRYLEDMKLAVAEIAHQRHFDEWVKEDALINDGGGEYGRVGSWRGQKQAQWRKDSTTGRWIKNKRKVHATSSDIYEDSFGLM